MNDTLNDLNVLLKTLFLWIKSDRVQDLTNSNQTTQQKIIIYQNIEKEILVGVQFTASKYSTLQTLSLY